jgi:predicted nucleotide-binding protein
LLPSRFFPWHNGFCKKLGGKIVVARKPKAVEPKRAVELVVSREEAKSRLTDRIEKGRELREQTITSSEGLEAANHAFDKWDTFNTEMLNRIFTAPNFAEEYSYYPGSMVMLLGVRTQSLGELIANFREGCDTKLHRLDSIIERLELIPLAAAVETGGGTKLDDMKPKRTNKVFVVHGRDEVSKTSLEVFLRENGLEPIVLHRQADEGLTIIEKFEKHSDVGYAFILLTPDEIAYLASDDSKPDNERGKEFRARPNVIFEFGYFVAKLSRARVCCLYTGDVELPSDVSGMIYKKFNHNIEEAAYSIIKDLRAAGYELR